MARRRSSRGRLSAINDEQQRLFLAVRPPADVVDRLGALPRPRRDGVRWVAAENWHVTLRFLGSARPASVIEAVDAARLPLPALAELGPQVVRLGMVAVLPAIGVTELAATVTAATAGLGTNDDSRPFFGHLTLARLRTEQATLDLIGRRFDAAFVVDAVELVASVPGDDGSRYTTVHRWQPDEPG